LTAPLSPEDLRKVQSRHEEEKLNGREHRQHQPIMRSGELDLRNKEEEKSSLVLITNIERGRK